MKTEAIRPPLHWLLVAHCSPLPQPSRRMREQGVDQPRLRGEVAAQRLRSAILAGDFIEQPLEFGAVAVDGLLEAAVGAAFAADLVDGFPAPRRAEPLVYSLPL